MKMRLGKIVLVVMFSFTYQAAATYVGILDVNVIPSQPSNIDSIIFNISGGAARGGGHVEYDQFAQNGTSIQLNLYVDMGWTDTPSYWSYSKQIQPLSAETYTLAVNAFYLDIPDVIEDTHIVDFTVIPEPATVAILAIGLPVFRVLSRRKI
ncbi:MAG: PEP-CTERM sorting domain-containing protein [Phycisphaerae bacterium]|nr:PEP-CTERM sorting domain-containing protein [Phycisphaerae bacterium]